MKLFQKIKLKYQSLNKSLSTLDLKKMYPNYFNQWIFRIAFLFIILLVVMNLYLNNWSLYSFSYNCNNYEYGGVGCINPFYSCPPKNIGDYCMEDVPSFVCEKMDCDSQYLPPGYSAGRQDILYKYATHFLFFILFLAFLVNHLFYVLRGKNDKI
jgi:hypothetical protein